MTKLRPRPPATLPTIPEVPPSPPRSQAPPRPPRYAAGDRLLVTAHDGRRHTATVVVRVVSGAPSPVLWLRLDSGRLCPLSAENVTVLGMLR